MPEDAGDRDQGVVRPLCDSLPDANGGRRLHGTAALEKQKAPPKRDCRKDISNRLASASFLREHLPDLFTCGTEY